MKRVEGYICDARIKDEGFEFDLLFGKNTGGGTDSHESLQTNGLIPFPQLREARIAQKEIGGREISGLVEVTVVKLRLGIAETEEDLTSLALHRKSSLIVIAYGDYLELFGTLVEGRFRSSGNLAGMLLSENGLKPLPTFARAEYVAAEIRRQAQCPASIATFFLRRIPQSFHSNS